MEVVKHIVMCKVNMEKLKKGKATFSGEKLQGKTLGSPGKQLNRLQKLDQTREELNTPDPTPKDPDCASL